jgi:hypothetical protein
MRSSVGDKLEHVAHRACLTLDRTAAVLTIKAKGKLKVQIVPPTICLATQSFDFALNPKLDSRSSFTSI